MSYKLGDEWPDRTDNDPYDGWDDPEEEEEEEPWDDDFDELAWECKKDEVGLHGMW